MTTPFTIGFANLAESIPSCAFRRQMLEEEIKAHPDFRLIVRDNNLDDATALANVAEFSQHPVNLAILFHINEKIGPELTQPFFTKNIPMIAVDVPMPLASYFGANNQQAGQLAGEALGRWVQQNWDGNVDKVLVLTESRVVSVVRDRVQYALGALRTVVPHDPKNVLHVDSETQKSIAKQRTMEVMERWKQFERIAVICINDDCALGAIEAARELGRESHMAVVGQGADDGARQEIANPRSAFVASTDYHLEQYSKRLVELALMIADHQRIPSKNYVEHVCVTKENIV